MRLLSRPLGVVRIRWGFAAEAGVVAAAVVEVFDPGGDPGVDLVVGLGGIRFHTGQCHEVVVARSSHATKNSG